MVSNKAPRSLTPVCPSLSDRLLQLQVMPLSRLHLRHFRRVQTCLVLYLLALLLYPQVSPLPPSSHLRPPRKRKGWLSQLPGYARHLWDDHSLPVTLQGLLLKFTSAGLQKHLKILMSKTGLIIYLLRPAVSALLPLLRNGANSSQSQNQVCGVILSLFSSSLQLVTHKI